MITTLDKRVAKALAAAVRATGRAISVVEVAQQAGRQGLLPRDFDNPNGTDALIAIALAVDTATRRPQGIDEPSEWRGVVYTALNIVVETSRTRAQNRSDIWRVQVKHRARMAQPRHPKSSGKR